MMTKKEIGDLKMQLAVVEKERNELKENLTLLEATIKKMKEQLELQDNEIKELTLQKNMSIGYLASSAKGENESLRETIAELMERNKEKDIQIMELNKAVDTYQKVEELILQSHSPICRKSTSADADHVIHNTPSHTWLSKSTPEKPFPGLETLSPTSSNGAPPPVPRRALSAQRSNSYDSSKFHRIVQCDSSSEDGKNKISCTSLPRDYGNQVNMVAQPKLQKDSVGSDVFTDDDCSVTKEPKKRKLLKRFLDRMKRVTTQEVADDKGRAFRRGGVRATAGPRLGGSQSSNMKLQMVQSSSFLKPFPSWTIDQVCTWLQDIGLAMYINDCRKWCKNGQHMLESSSHEIEKELKIGHILHRKKLKLALQAMNNGGNHEYRKLMQLTTDWITKWLDDIGLPQYKDQFSEACIDGHLLNNITVDDLLYLKINNTLHHMSIRRGIQVLRIQQFNLETLKRRPSMERSSHFPSTTLSGSTADKERDVTLWTNHRVMEWLRMIDLSEYAVNLRGSGVHGALLMLEPRFTVEHLANILHIPVNKTLIRRHLSGHFVNLVGQTVQSKKREMEQRPGMALTLNMKVRPKKTNIFKRGRPKSEYICPRHDSEEIASFSESTSNDSRRVKSAVAMYKKELSKRESKGHQDGKGKT